MNPYAIIGVVVLWGGSIWYAIGVGRDMEIATQAREDRAVVVASEAAASAAAKAIAAIKVNHTTIRQQATTEIRRDPIYVDCNHPDAVRRLLDEALENRTVPVGGGKLPGDAGKAP